MTHNLFLHEEKYRTKDLTKMLSECTLAVCGVGALGSNLVNTLVRQGFSKIKVCDMDRVEVHNINTQVYDLSDCGSLKVDALNFKTFKAAEIELDTFNKELTSTNIDRFLRKANLVVDTFDNSKSRRIVQECCRKNDILCIHAGLYEDYGEVIWDKQYKVPKDIGGEDVCEYPLARNLISLVVTVLAEEIVCFCLNQPRYKNWSITLKDLAIREI